MPENDSTKYTGGPLDPGVLMRGKKDRLSHQMGTSLIQSGFATLGGGLAKALDNPAAGAGLAQVGQDIANTLRDEWYKQEAENFRSLYGQAYQQELNQVMQNYSQSMTMVVDPNAMEETKQKGVAEQLPPQAPKAAGKDGKPAPAPKGPQEQSASEREITSTRTPGQRTMGFIDPMTGSFIPADDIATASRYVQNQTQQYIGRLQAATTEFLNAASQYGDNPYISQQAEQVVQSIAQTVAGEAEARQAAVDFAENQRAEQRADMAQERLELEKARDERQAQFDQHRLDAIERDQNAQVEIARVFLGDRSEGLTRDELLEWNAQREMQDKIAMETGRLPSYVSPDNMTNYLYSTDHGKDVLKTATEFVQQEMKPDVLVEAKRLAQQDYPNTKWAQLGKEERDAYIQAASAQPHIADMVMYKSVRKAAVTAFASRPGVTRTQAEKLADELVAREYPQVYKVLNRKPGEAAAPKTSSGFSPQEREILEPIIVESVKDIKGSKLNKFKVFAREIQQNRERTPEELNAAILMGEDLLNSYKGNAQAQREISEQLGSLYMTRTNGQSRSEAYADFENAAFYVLENAEHVLREDPVAIQDAFMTGQTLLKVYTDKAFQSKVRRRLTQLRELGKQIGIELPEVNPKRVSWLDLETHPAPRSAPQVGGQPAFFSSEGELLTDPTLQGAPSEPPMSRDDRWRPLDSAVPYPLASEEEQTHRRGILRGRILK